MARAIAARWLASILKQWATGSWPFKNNPANRGRVLSQGSGVILATPTILATPAASGGLHLIALAAAALGCLFGPLLRPFCAVSPG